MKDYTVIYTTSPVDRYNSRLTRYKYFTTDNLQLAIDEDSDIGGWAAVWFVFDGHCKITEGL